MATLLAMAAHAAGQTDILSLWGFSEAQAGHPSVRTKLARRGATRPSAGRKVFRGITAGTSGGAPKASEWPSKITNRQVFYFLT